MCTLTISKKTQHTGLEIWNRWCEKKWRKWYRYWWWWWFSCYGDYDDDDDDDDDGTGYFPSASSSSVPQFVKSDPRFFLSFDCFAMEFFSIQERVSSLTFQYILQYITCVQYIQKVSSLTFQYILLSTLQKKKLMGLTRCLLREPNF